MKLTLLIFKHCEHIVMHCSSVRKKLWSFMPDSLSKRPIIAVTNPETPSKPVFKTRYLAKCVLVPIKTFACECGQFVQLEGWFVVCLGNSRANDCH